MNEAKADTYLILAKTAVGKDPIAILNYCRFIGLEDNKVLELVRQKVIDHEDTYSE